MTEILGFLSFLFGPLMRIMYNFIGNYGLTMVLFTVLIRLVTLPLAIKQQKSHGGQPDGGRQLPR